VKRLEKIPSEDWRDAKKTFALDDFGPEENAGAMQQVGRFRYSRLRSRSV
jgi:hypothetical protein